MKKFSKRFMILGGLLTLALSGSVIAPAYANDTEDKTLLYEKTIPFEEVRIEVNTLPEGVEVISTEGSAGTEAIYKEVNDDVPGSFIKYSEVTKDPINKVILVGSNPVVQGVSEESRVLKEKEDKLEAEKAAEAERMAQVGAPRIYTIDDLRFQGVINWGGYRFTYYSEKVLPGNGLSIPGRHVSSDCFVSDSDGYIVLANDAPKGTVIDTPFGMKGKVYDRGTVGNHYDVYTC